MAVLIGSTINPTVLSKRLADGATTKYMQAKLYNLGGTLRHTVNMDHVVSGTYAGSFMGNGSDSFLIANYDVYTDSGRTTIDSVYGLEEDTIQFFLMEAPLGSYQPPPQINTDAMVNTLKEFIREELKQEDTPKEESPQVTDNIDKVQRSIEEIKSSIEENGISVNTLLKETGNKTIDSINSIGELVKRSVNDWGSVSIKNHLSLNDRLSVIAAQSSSLRSSFIALLRIFVSFLDNRATTRAFDENDVIRFSEQSVKEIIQKFNASSVQESAELIKKMIELLNIEEERRFKKLYEKG